MPLTMTLLAFFTALVALVGMVVYPTIASYSQTTNTYLLVFLTIFRLALFFAVFHAIGYWLYRLLARSNSLVRAPQHIETNHIPCVSVLIPVKDEPIELVKRMFCSLKNIQYPCLQIVVIDNSTTSQLKLFRETASDAGLSVAFIRKSDPKGFKAGALNRGLEQLDSACDYVLVLDVDHAPEAGILNKLVPKLGENQSLAFVQAPQSYLTTPSSIVEGAYCYRQHTFYDQICSGLCRSGTLFFSGTNCLFRKKALDEIGGFDETSLTEDLRTSVLLHQKNWAGRYIDQPVALGLPPADLRTYHTQQRRWAIGTYQNFVFVLQCFVRKPSLLTLEQTFFYLGWNGTYYLQGLTSFTLILCSIVFLLLNSRNHSFWTDTIAFPVFVATLVSTMAHEKRRVNVSWSRLLAYTAFMFGDSWVHLLALIDYIFSRSLVFEVTKKATQDQSGVSLGFISYHLVIVTVLGPSVIGSIYWDTFDPVTIIWPLMFFSQALTVTVLVVAESLHVK
jgi:cellulose synthase (UDP-forming)